MVHTLTKNEILEKIRDTLEDKLGNDRREFTEDASLSNDLGADSLDIVELIMIFERIFDIRITSEFDGKLNTINDFVIYVLNYDEKNLENKKYFNVEE